jgi:hypothetical protein
MDKFLLTLLIVLQKQSHFDHQALRWTEGRMKSSELHGDAVDSDGEFPTDHVNSDDEYSDSEFFDAAQLPDAKRNNSKSNFLAYSALE